MYVSMNKKYNRIRVPVTVSLDLEYRQFYEQQFGKGKISELFNAVLREEYEKQKKDEAHLSPVKSPVISNNNIMTQTNILDYLSERPRPDELVQYIKDLDKQNENVKISTLMRNARVIETVAKTINTRRAKQYV